MGGARISSLLRAIMHKDEVDSCGVVSKKRENGTPPRSVSFSWAMTIGSRASRTCLTCSASRSSDQLSSHRYSSMWVARSGISEALSTATPGKDAASSFAMRRAPWLAGEAQRTT